jgi:pyruvate formate lyase activating enzyme
MPLTGLTFNVQRFSTEDGPGIRSTVFFKGCPLRCRWCHNPEGLRPSPDLVWYDVRCIGARECLKACPEGALELAAQGICIDRTRCTVCGTCVSACPTAALEVIGRSWTAEEMLQELQRDRAFYETSGGGVTFSGGEPMQQVGFLAELLPLCDGAGLHVALDTCGAVSWARYESILRWVDLVLLDIKLIDPERHRAATGVSNEGILENGRRLARAGMPLWIRTPVIPGWTADRENIAAIGRFIRNELPTVERWDLLAYTNLGRPKYRRLDLDYALAQAPLLARSVMEELAEAAAESVPVARWSGATCD